MTQVAMLSAVLENGKKEAPFVAVSAKERRMCLQAERQLDAGSPAWVWRPLPFQLIYSRGGADLDEPITWDQVHALMEELRGMARSLLAHEHSAQSLSPTALVLTALRRQKRGGWQVPFDGVEVTWPNRKYFFGAMYRAMWQALVDHAKKRLSKKYIRPVQVEQLHLENVVHTANERPEQILALRVALKRLRARYPDWADLVEHRYISGYTVEESARVMGVSERTVRRRREMEWERVRLLLFKEVLHILNEEEISWEDVDE